MLPVRSDCTLKRRAGQPSSQLTTARSHWQDLQGIYCEGGSLACFELTNDGAGGTDLTLTDTGVPALDRTEVIAGWVSVLMALKAAVDFSVDL